MSIWAYVVVSGFAALFVWFWWNGRVRAGAVQALAATLGFHYLGEALPRNLDLAGSPLASASSVWNVIDGEPSGKRIVAFDCAIGQGKGSWQGTIIAVKTEASTISVSFFDPALHLEQVRDWVLIYRPKDYGLIPSGLMPIPELQAYLEAIAI